MSAHRWLAGGPSPNPAGRPKAQTVTSRRLAEVLREGWSPESIRDWLRDVAAGKDPDAKDGAVTITPPWEIRMKAVSMYLERALGAPLQHVALEAEIQSTLRAGAQTIDPHALPAGDLEKLEGLLAALMATAPSVDVIEVDGHELPATP